MLVVVWDSNFKKMASQKVYQPLEPTIIPYLPLHCMVPCLMVASTLSLVS